MDHHGVTSQVLGADNTWYCPQCKEHQRAKKRMELWTLPDVLIVHLKRFSQDRWHRHKVTTLVDFPFEGLDLGRYVPNSLVLLYG